MPRRATYAGTHREKARYRQRVHAWTKRGLVEGVDWELVDGVPIQLRSTGERPKAQRNDPPKPPLPSSKALLEMHDHAIADLDYEASLRVALLREKWERERATVSGALHPVDQLPAMPPDIQEDLRYYGDHLAAYYTRRHPKPYGSTAD